MNETKEFTAIPHLHVATSLLIEKMHVGRMGDVLSDQELTALCGHSTAVGGEGYGYLQTAIKYCRRVGIVWERVRGIAAIKCLNNEERVASARGGIDHIQRVGKRALATMASVEVAKLPAGMGSEHYAQMSALGFVMTYSQPKTLKMLAANPGAAFDPQKTLEYLKGNGE
jgi:hypothetical protein